MKIPEGFENLRDFIIVSFLKLIRKNVFFFSLNLQGYDLH